MSEGRQPLGLARRRRASIRRVLGSREPLRRAMLLREILGPPIALREHRRDTDLD